MAFGSQSQPSVHIPFHTAEQLRALELVSPGIADRLVALYSEEANRSSDRYQAIIKIRAEAMKKEYFNRNLGMILGFLIAVLFLSAAFYLVLHGHDGAGGLIGFSGVVTIVARFIQGRQHSNQHRLEPFEGN